MCLCVYKDNESEAHSNKERRWKCQENKWEKEAEIHKNNEEIQLEIYSSVKCHVFRHPLKTNSHLLTKSKSYFLLL